MHFVKPSERAKINKDALKYKKVKQALWTITRAVLLVGIGYIILYPIMFMLTMSFMTHMDIVSPAVVWIPREWVLTNYRNAIELMGFLNAFRASIELSLVTAFLQTVSSALIGYGFARYKFWGRDVLFGVVILTLLVPPSTIVISQILQMRFFDPLGIFSLFTGEPINLLNRRMALYLPAALGMGLRSGIFIYMFRQYFRGQPKELEDAARVDGCGHIGIFARVMSPNAGSIYLTVLLFAIVWNWNDYYNALMFVDRIQTLPVALSVMRDRLLQASQVAHLGIVAADPYTQAASLMAGAFLSLAPVLAMYVILQRYFTESVERSGIVG
ncbi:MAG: carbohydrate ABC transporter permease [Defluviitaleaceae bacterium]|nr:carbohydrate ABC transporter permease [Defluviitaleaceae bacterium]MCL2274373.1 carbohydrate ABC transporter permease [Defluviitaleaceae bacterium]